MKYDYIIVGAGLFGSVCAYELNKKGKKVLIIDKRNHIAGNIYTEKKENITIHKYGAHIFHTSKKEIWDYINQFGEFNNYINSPIAIYKNELYNLPFNMNTFSKIWKITRPNDAKKKIALERKEITKEPTNLEEQAISLVGRTIYEKLIKGYTEKQWGKDCKQLPPFIIKRLPVRFTYNNNYFNDIYQGIPKNGYTNIINNMLNGIDLKLGIDFIKEKDKYLKMCDNIIYTGSIDEYYDYRYGKLEYRSLKFEEKIYNVENYQGNAVINWTSKDMPYTRSIEHKHFNNDISNKTVISYEYPIIDNKNPFYPINDNKNNNLYLKYKSLAENEKNVYFGGRLGEYKYYDMDKTIEQALELIKRIEE